MRYCTRTQGVDKDLRSIDIPIEALWQGVVFAPQLNIEFMEMNGRVYITEQHLQATRLILTYEEESIKRGKIQQYTYSILTQQR